MKGKNFIKTILSLGLIALIIFVLGQRIVESQNQKNNVEEQIVKTQKVKLINTSDYKKIKDTINTVGTVEAVNNNDVRGEVGGKITEIYVKNGDQIEAGQVIAKLDDSLYQIQLAQASATIERINAQKNLQIAGATDEQIEKAKAGIIQAQVALNQGKAQVNQVKVANENNLKRAKSNLEKIENALKDSETVSQEGVSAAYDNLYVNKKSNLSFLNSTMVTIGNLIGKKPGDETSNDSYENVLGAQDNRTLRNLIREFESFRSKLAISSEKFNSIGKFMTHEEILSYSSETEEGLNDMSNLLELSRQVLENTYTQTGFTIQALDGLKTEINGKIALNNREISTLQNSVQAVKNAKLGLSTQQKSLQIDYERALEEIDNTKAQNRENLEIAERSIQIQEAALKQAELTLKQVTAGPRNIDLAAVNASVKEAQSTYSLIENNKAKTIIKAPFGGKIADLPVKVGDVVSPGQVIASIVNSQSINIKAFISNQDRTQVGTSSKVLINKSIEGKISNISPRIDPVNRKIEITIDPVKQDNTLFVGEYTDIQISGNKEDAAGNIYYLPLKAIKVSSEGSYVFIVNEQGILEKQEIVLGDILGDHIEVTNGLADETKIVESLRGLKDGEKVEVIN